MQPDSKYFRSFAMDLPNIQLFAFVICGLINLGYSGFAITSFEDCDPNVDYPIKLQGTFKTVDHMQLLDISLVTPVPIDDETKLKLNIDGMGDKKSKPVSLLSGAEQAACTTLHKYMGEFLSEIEKQVKLEPGACPIPAGTYSIKEYPIHFEKIPIIKNFPFGIIRAVMKTTSKDNSVLFCKVVNLANVPE